MADMEGIFNLVAGGEEAVSSFLRTSGGWAFLLVFLVAATQTGFVLGPLLPGTTILFICGVFARTEPEVLNVLVVGAVAVAGALTGSSLHYLLGRWAGAKLFVKDKGLWNRQNLVKTEEFLAKHGKASLVLAPSVPIVRTFSAVVAGAARMPLAPFFAASALGVFLWILTALGSGYLAGIFPGAKVWVLLFAGCLSLALGLRVAWKTWKDRQSQPAS